MNSRWSPGIGDPDVISWLTVAAYLMASLACGLAARRSVEKNGENCRGAVPFWGVLAGLLLALGINKELDFQTLMTQMLRDAAKTEGWYAWRRPLQAAFIFAILAKGIGVGVIVVRRIGVLRRNMALAICGMAMVFTYVIIRAASFNHIALSMTQHLLGHQVIWPIEICGIGLVCYAALRDGRAGGAAISTR